MKTNLQRDLETLNADIIKHIDSYVTNLQSELKSYLDYIRDSETSSTGMIHLDDLERILLSKSKHNFNDVIGEFFGNSSDNCMFDSEYKFTEQFEKVIEDNEHDLKTEDHEDHYNDSKKLHDLIHSFNCTGYSDTYAKYIEYHLLDHYNLDINKLFASRL